MDGQLLAPRFKALNRVQLASVDLVAGNRSNPTDARQPFGLNCGFNILFRDIDRITGWLLS